MSFNELVQSIFNGYRESKTFKERQHAKKFEELNHTPFLFSDKYLKDLYLDINTIDDCNKLLSYMDRFELYGKGYDFCDQLYIHTHEDRLKKIENGKKENKDEWLDWV